MALIKYSFLVFGLAAPALASPASSLDVRAASRSKGGCGGGFMTQYIDHSNYSAGTFQQQIQVNMEHFKPGGPIMLFHGEEAAKMICVESTTMVDYAKQLGGIAAAIEHRYFGESAPFGPKLSYTSATLSYLTLDNVFEDTVRFINEIRANVTGAADSKTIIASGSYGAYLATAFRLNRPESIFGAIASAPPISAFAPANGKVPQRFAWWDWVSNVYMDRSPSASAAIKNALQTLEQITITGDLSSLKEKLGLCREPKDPLDAAYLKIAIQEPFQLAAEFNYPFVTPGRSSIAKPLDKFVDLSLKKAEDPLGLLKETSMLWYKSANSSIKCIDIETSTQAAVSLIQTVPFSYITCSYLPLVNSGISKDSIFIPQDPPLIGTTKTCMAQFNLTPMTAEQLEEQYKMSREHYVNSKRIIFVTGQYDPTTSVAPYSFPTTSDRNASKVLYVSNMAHREDLFAPSKKDSPEVVQARAMEVSTIKEWLGRV